MFKRVRRSIHSFPRGLVLALGMILAQLSAAGAVIAMDVTAVRIGAGNRSVDGTLVPMPYFLDVTVEGSGLAEVRVTTPQGTELELSEVMPGVWWNEMTGYSGLEDLRASPSVGFGDFLINLVGDRGENDSATLYFDPGQHDAFIEFGEILSPAHEQDSVVLEPTFEWACSGDCSARSWDVRLVQADGSWRFRDAVATEVGAWAPGALEPYASYRFSCQSVGSLDDAQDRTTDGGDSLTYESVFQTRNEVELTARERIDLSVDRHQLTWTALTAESMYEVVRGDLRGLRDTGGDFALNTEECLSDDIEATALPYAADPPPGEGHWFLVRSAISPDGYESLISTQPEARTPEIVRSPGACSGFSCPPDVPAFYDQPNRIAGGVCVGVAGADGPPACPEAQYTRAEGDLAVIKAAYPFTAAIEDSTTGAGQQWNKIPFDLLCAGFEAAPLSEHVFDELNVCYQGTPSCKFGCGWVNPQFQWAVNVLSLVAVYDEQAARYGGWCELDSMVPVLSPLGGFHAQDAGDGWWEWTVHATSQCDYEGCKCDAEVTGWTHDGQPGEFYEGAVTNNSSGCTDLRFNF